MKNNTMKLVVSLIALAVVVGAIGFVAKGFYERATFEFENPIVSMEIEGHGTIKIELYPDMAPDTVRNFISLINDGYYDGLTFHRLDQDLALIQGGCALGTGASGSDYSVVGEFPRNNFRQNTMTFERGVVGLARQDFSQWAEIDPSLVNEGHNTGFAQFFIMTDSEPMFNGFYAGFGRVIEGMEIVDALLVLPTEIEIDEETGEGIITTTPVTPPVMTRVTVETFGVEYREPRLVRTFDLNTFLTGLFGL